VVVKLAYLKKREEEVEESKEDVGYLKAKSNSNPKPNGYCLDLYRSQNRGPSEYRLPVCWKLTLYQMNNGRMVVV